MVEFIIDANLPDIGIWSSERFQHVRDLDETWTDTQIWDYARSRGLVIITKDADFSWRMISHGAPPKVIYLRIGNMKLNDFTKWVTDNWSRWEHAIGKHQMITVHRDHWQVIP